MSTSRGVRHRAGRASNSIGIVLDACNSLLLLASTSRGPGSDPASSVGGLGVIVGIGFRGRRAHNNQAAMAASASPATTPITIPAIGPPLKPELPLELDAGSVVDAAVVVDTPAVVVATSDVVVAVAR